MGTRFNELCTKTYARVLRKMNKRLTAVIQREPGGYFAMCPEFDVASQGDTVESACENLREALELFFECASPAEIEQRFGDARA